MPHESPAADGTKPERPDRVSRIRRVVYAFTIALRLVVIVVVVHLNVRLYRDIAPTYRPGRLGADATAQLAYLDRALAEGAAARMQERFPEGYFFSYATFGLASLDAASLLPPEEAARHLEAARRSLDALRSDEGKAPFAEGAMHEGAFGAFYWGYRAFLAGRLLDLVGVDADPELRAAFVEDAAYVASLFPEKGSPFPESYQGQAWPCDAVVAMAALGLHDRLLPPRYEVQREHFIARAYELIDPETRLLPHRVYPVTGAFADGSRATSQVIIQRFLPWVDEERARIDYPVFRELFAARRLGLPAVREYPPGVMGEGDVDSGPLLLGVSASSSVVAIGAALTHDDRALAEPLIALGDVLGFPFERDGEKTYAFGLLPISDAFFLWSKLAYAARPPGFEGAASFRELPDVASKHYRAVVHLLSGLFLLPLVAVPIVRFMRRRRAARAEQ